MEARRATQTRDHLLTPSTPLSDQASPGGAAASGTDPGMLAEVQAQVDGVRAVMQENVGQMLTNMDKAAALETTSSELAMQARSFQQTARKTKTHMRWQNLKIQLAVAAVCLVVLLIILASAGVFSGGGDGDGNRRHLLFAADQVAHLMHHR
uniref:V-SNARE coiled-coil homology domain-containing protein n=1 Tax=Coccolithus braarudii TaxID=221442 RepID=A0A7S0LTQ9_9EUKA|mmetsp:Transcript_948/g.1925  ORF Transcript_948/g.1925 Transcript_948/m.1925 type:complete len:152 (+) Transcript_948:82-537(+)